MLRLRVGLDRGNTPCGGVEGSLRLRGTFELEQLHFLSGAIVRVYLSRSVSAATTELEISGNLLLGVGMSLQVKQVCCSLRIEW